MTQLVEILLSPQHREQLEADVIHLVEAHIASREGLRGLGLRTAMSMAKKARPDLLPRAVARLLPESALALEPLYQQFRKTKAHDFSLFLQPRSAEAAQLLLGVADRKAATMGNAALKSVYGKLRGGAEKEVLAVMPALGELLGRYLAQSENPSS